ncbi:hypothetical protein [Ruegeria sp. Ofav3-42]|uniref:phage head spike fiber domain-containing protein n=1 Tax=Ruegeria sp. Ofav3-42 TaxID=2917759 RepID=UPI001EF57B4F|nr:hypothetical protein [Ruegeria sp. Ofav3-42]MCG7518841.1 hypothetical protein [Ruegeria sp. Ofav3-42]
MGVGRFGAGRFASGRFGRGGGLFTDALNPLFLAELSNDGTLFQDAAGSIPATAPGHPVAQVTDKSGNGHHALQPVNDDYRPTLARHPASGLRQNLNGTSDFSAFNFGGSGSGSNTLEVDAAIAPDGSQTAARVTFSAHNQVFTQTLNLPSGDYTGSLWVKGVAGETIRCRLSGGGEFTHAFDGGWEQISGSISGAMPTSFNISTWAGSTARVIEVWHPQHEAGTAITPYQKRVDRYDVTETGQRDIWYLSDDQIDDELTVTLPDLGSDATEFWADQDGITINGGQTIAAGGRPLPGSAHLYAHGIIDRALTGPETIQLQQYLEMKSGASA